MVKIVSRQIGLKTKGNPDLHDITSKVAETLESSKLKNGTLTVFVIGSTAAITSFEFEPGMVRDVREMFENLISSRKSYHHDQTWGDANGFSHLRASLQGPSLSVPFEESKLLLGTWQQIVLAEFDNRPRDRKIIVQIIGE